MENSRIPLPKISEADSVDFFDRNSNLRPTARLLKLQKFSDFGAVIMISRIEQTRQRPIEVECQREKMPNSFE